MVPLIGIRNRRRFNTSVPTRVHVESPDLKSEIMLNMIFDIFSWGQMCIGHGHINAGRIRLEDLRSMWD
jgi:hypothetical protein